MLYYPTNSKLNNDSDGNYSPLIDVSRDIRVSFAIYDEENDPLQESYYKEFILGEINNIKWDKSPIPIKCKDKVMNTLDYTFIEEETDMVVDSNGDPIESGAPVQDVMQQILNDWGTGYSLYVPEDPGSNTEPYTLSKQTVHKAIEELYMGIGWQVRPRYVNGDLRPALLPVERNSTTIDWTFNNYGVIENYEKHNRSVRNRIKVVYQTPDGEVKHVVVEDSESQQEHDIRFMEIKEGTFSQVYDSTKATNLANYALADLKDPYIQKRVDIGFFPFVHIGDHYEFKADYIHTDVDQQFVVEGYTITASNDTWSTVLDLRGSEATKYEGWLEREARDGVGDPNREKPPGQVENLTVYDGYRVTPSGESIPWLKAEWDKRSYSDMYKYHIFLRFELESDELDDYNYVQIGDRYFTEWDRVAVKESESFRTENVEKRAYQIKVVAEHTGGIQSDFTSAPYKETVITGKETGPSGVTIEEAYYDQEELYVSWIPSSDKTVKQYEFRTDMNVGTDTSALLFRSGSIEYKIDKPRNMSYTFYIYALDTNGKYSDETKVELHNPGISTLEIVDGDVTLDENTIKLNLPAVYDKYDTTTGNTLSDSEKSQITPLGYKIILNNLDGGHPSRTKIVDNTEYVEFQIPDKSSWGIQVGAFNTAVNPDYNTTEFENTISNELTYNRPSTPTGLTLNTSVDNSVMPSLDTASIQIIKDISNM